MMSLHHATNRIHQDIFRLEETKRENWDLQKEKKDISFVQCSECGIYCSRLGLNLIMERDASESRKVGSSTLELHGLYSKDPFSLLHDSYAEEGIVQDLSIYDGTRRYI